jgi:thiol:disulfide interchange protein DsbA
MKLISKIATALLASAALTLPALAAGPFEEGTHYKRLADPVPVREPGKIEVAEVFSYACGHCFNFEPLLQKWTQDLPEDVNVIKLHVKWDRTTENLARALYTAKALGVMDKVHMPLFRALHIARKRLQSQEQLADFFAEQGVDREAFNKTFGSFGITSQLKQGESKIAGARISGTPSLIVDGRYVIDPSANVDHETMLEVADYLIQQIREERGG